LSPRGPRNATPCRRKGCGQRFDAHAGGACPDGLGNFGANGPSATRPSTSFSEEEVLTMADMLEAVQRREDTRPFVREHSRILGILLGKAQRMKAWIAERARGGKP
jgi:hypothetical protein